MSNFVVEKKQKLQDFIIWYDGKDAMRKEVCILILDLNWMNVKLYAMKNYKVWPNE